MSECIRSVAPALPPPESQHLAGDLPQVARQATDRCVATVRPQALDFRWPLAQIQDRSSEDARRDRRGTLAVAPTRRLGCRPLEGDTLSCEMTGLRHILERAFGAH